MTFATTKANHRRFFAAICVYLLAVAVAPGDAVAEDVAPTEHETIRLADGTQLQIEKWGETYETFEYRPPLNGDDWFDPEHRPPADRKIETVIDGADRRLKFDGPPGWGCVRLDPKHNKMYWIASAGSHPVGKVVRANLNGKDVKFLVDKLVDPRDLTLDLQNDKMYWTEFPNDLTQRGIRRASLSGGKVEKVIVGLEGPGPMVIDAQNKRVVFGMQGGSQRRILEVQFDGSGQRMLADGEFPRSMDADFGGGMLYWAAGDDRINRMPVAGGPVETVMNLDSADTLNNLGQRTFTTIRALAYDPDRKKMYWTGNYGHLCRANVDGSQPELLVKVLAGGGSLALDTQHGYVYWTEGRSMAGGMYSRIRRIKIPPPLKRLTKNAPPLIQDIVPPAQTPGKTVVIKGSGFTGTTRVAFSDNEAGKHAHAQFRVVSDSELSVTIPKLSSACGASPITVLTSNGVTVTLPLDLAVYNFMPYRGAGAAFDRLKCQARDLVCWVNEHADLSGHERAVAFVAAKGEITGTPAGGTVHYLKNGARTVVSETMDRVIYHEPFALIAITHYLKPNQVEFVPVPAVRPSFVPKLFAYIPK